MPSPVAHPSGLLTPEWLKSDTGSAHMRDADAYDAVENVMKMAMLSWDTGTLAWVKFTGAGGGGGGGGAATIADGADVAEGARGDTAWDGAAASATGISIWKATLLKLEAIRLELAGTLTVGLPTGASTAARQDTGNTSIASIDTKTPALVGGRVPVDGSGVTQPISAAALPLPAGAATEAGNLATIAGKDFATQTTLALIKAKTDNIDVLLSTRTKPADAQHVIIDSSASIATTGPLTDTQLRAAPVPVSGPLTDTQIRATALPVSGPLTDVQLRATAVPVSGPLTDTQLRASAVPVSLASVPSHPVTNAGTFAVQSTDAGDVASGSADSGNPVKVGAIAKSALPVAVADAQRVNILADLFGRLRIIIERPKLLGAYKFESGRLAVLASAHASTGGFFWLINPVASGVTCKVKKLMATSVPTAVTAFASAPRVTVERVTFTGTASGAVITPAKRDSNDAGNVCSVRSASTGLTLVAGATISDFTVPPVLTAVGIAVPVDQYLYDSTDEDDYIVLRPGTLTGQPVTVAMLTTPDAPYEPHPDDPSALLRVCPACRAPVGAWCGGVGDVHTEREE